MSRVKRIIELFLLGGYPSSTAEKFTEWISSPIDARDKDEVLNSFWEDIDQLATPQTEISYTSTLIRINKRRKNIKRQSLYAMISRISAIIVVPIMIIALSFIYMNRDKSPTEWLEIYAPYGETRSIILSDSSHISINSGSKLIYPKNFSGKKRQVFLSGEAYASITPDKAHPFILSAGDVDILVLGTKFNVKSYIEDTEVEVALIEGSIDMNTKLEGHEHSIRLSPGEMVKLDKATGSIEKINFSAQYYKPTVNGGGLCFVNQRLCDIATQLQRMFDVDIIIKDKALEQERYYSAFVNNETLDQILNSINSNKTMSIEREENVIYISRRKLK